MIDLTPRPFDHTLAGILNRIVHENHLDGSTPPHDIGAKLAIAVAEYQQKHDPAGQMEDPVPDETITQQNARLIEEKTALEDRCHKLQEDRDGWRMQAEAMTQQLHHSMHDAETIDELCKALAFARSVIKSGEPWSATCEKVIGGALLGIREDARVLSQVLQLQRQHATRWQNRDDHYWLLRLGQEVSELILSLSGEHSDPPDHELRQIASIAINWLYKRAREKRAREVAKI